MCNKDVLFDISCLESFESFNKLKNFLYEFNTIEKFKLRSLELNDYSKGNMFFF